jgi:hypothetical protein
MGPTYSEVTVAKAAPLTPRPSGKISTASSIAFNRLPAAVCMMTSVPCLTTLNELHKGISNNKKTVTTTNHVFK